MNNNNNNNNNKLYLVLALPVDPQIFDVVALYFPSKVGGGGGSCHVALAGLAPSV